MKKLNKKERFNDAVNSVIRRWINTVNEGKFVTLGGIVNCLRWDILERVGDRRRNQSKTLQMVESYARSELVFMLNHNKELRDKWKEVKKEKEDADKKELEKEQASWLEFKLN